VGHFEHDNRGLACPPAPTRGERPWGSAAAPAPAPALPALPVLPAREVKRASFDEAALPATRPRARSLGEVSGRAGANRRRPSGCSRLGTCLATRAVRATTSATIHGRDDDDDDGGRDESARCTADLYALGGYCVRF
jgi:hypothetical protein